MITLTYHARLQKLDIPLMDGIQIKQTEQKLQQQTEFNKTLRFMLIGHLIHILLLTTVMVELLVQVKF